MTSQLTNQANLFRSDDLLRQAAKERLAKQVVSSQDPSGSGAQPRRWSKFRLRRADHGLLPVPARLGLSSRHAFRRADGA